MLDWNEIRKYPCTGIAIGPKYPYPHEAVNATFDFALQIAFTLKFLFLVNMATNKSLLLSAIPASKNPIASSYKGVAFR